MHTILSLTLGTNDDQAPEADGTPSSMQTKGGLCPPGCVKVAWGCDFSEITDNIRNFAA